MLAQSRVQQKGRQRHGDSLTLPECHLGWMPVRAVRSRWRYVHKCSMSVKGTCNPGKLYVLPNETSPV